MKDNEFANSIQEILDMRDNQPERFNAILNLQLIDCSREEGYIDFGFKVEEWCLNPYGGIHGGAICSLLDTGMGVGAVAISQKFVSTADLSVSFLKAMTSDYYIIRVEYNHIGRRMIRVTGKVLSDAGSDICATAMGSFVITESRAKGLQD